MKERKNYNFKNRNNNIYYFKKKNQNQAITDKIQKKMKNYAPTHFNFILEKDVIELSEDNSSEHSINNNSQNVPFLSNYEIPQNDFLSQNIGNCSPAKIPQSFYNYNNFSSNQEKNKKSDSFEQKKIIENKNQKKFEENESDDENIEIMWEKYQKIKNKSPKKSNKNVFSYSKERNSLIDNILLGKKIDNKNRNSSNQINKFLPKEDINGIKKANLMVEKLIEKYSYGYIFNLFIKTCSKYIPEIDADFDQQTKMEINEIINELGMEQAMKIILSIDKSKGNIEDKKDVIKTNNTVFKEKDSIIPKKGKENKKQKNKNLKDDEELYSNRNYTNFNNITEIIYLDEESEDEKSFPKNENLKNIKDDEEDFKKDLFDLLLYSFE